jgi:hypothetical protein
LDSGDNEIGTLSQEMRTLQFRDGGSGTLGEYGFPNTEAPYGKPLEWFGKSLADYTPASVQATAVIRGW